MRLIYNLVLFPTLLLLVAARDERAYRGGKAEYRKADLKGETQFQHQKTLDGVVLGCFGYVDGEGNFFATHWMADEAGYRSFNLSNPDSVSLERGKSLNGGTEAPLKDLFPVDCTEKGDMGRLQRMAAKIKEEFESSNDFDVQNRNSPSNDGQDEDTPQPNNDSANPQPKSKDDKPQPKKDEGKPETKTPEKKENLRLVNLRDPESFRKPTKKPSRGRKPTSQPVKTTTTDPVKEPGTTEKFPEPTSDPKKADVSPKQDDKDDKRPASNQTPKSSPQPEKADGSPKHEPKSSKEPNQVDDSPKQAPKFSEEPSKAADLRKKENVAEDKNDPKPTPKKGPTDPKQDPKSSKEPNKADDSPQDDQDEDDSEDPEAAPKKGSTDPKKDPKATPKKDPKQDPKSSKEPSKADDSPQDDQDEDDSEDPEAAPKKGSTDPKKDPKATPKKDPKQDPKSSKEPSKADDSPQEDQDEDDSEDPEAAPKKGSTDPKKDPKATPKQDPKSSKEPSKADDSPQEDQDVDDSEDPEAAPKKGSTDPKQDMKAAKEPSKVEEAPKQDPKSSKEPTSAGEKPQLSSRTGGGDEEIGKAPSNLPARKDTSKKRKQPVLPSARNDPNGLLLAPPFEEESPVSSFAKASDSNDVAPSISRVLPVAQQPVAPFLINVPDTEPAGGKPTASKAAPSSLNSDVYDEVEDDDDDTDAVDSVAPGTPKSPDESSCIEIVLKVPSDARHVVVRTENPKFKTQGDMSPNEMVRKIAPGVYDIQLGKFNKVIFEKYGEPKSEQEPFPSSLGKAFNYDELAPKAKDSKKGPAKSGKPYLPKANPKQGKAAKDEENPRYQRRIPDRFLAIGGRM